MQVTAPRWACARSAFRLRWSEPRNEGVIREVRDDGVGMDPALAFAASEGERSGLHHIGLANVQRRILLNFGEPFGLSVQSERGRFTLVRFLLPEARPRRREDA